MISSRYLGAAAGGPEGPPTRAPPSMIGRLGRDSLWNISGQVVPAICALVVIPPIYARLGTAAFGGLTLAWTIVGMFGILDFGLSRSLTHSVAAQRHDESGRGLQRMTATGMALLFALGLVLAAALTLAGAPLIGLLDKAREVDARQLQRSLWVVSAAIPVVTLSQGARGIMEGLGLFKQVNLLRMPQGALTFLGPLAAVYVTPTLESAVIGLLAGRVVGMVSFLFALFARVRPSFQDFSGSRRVLEPLLKYGGWLSVSSLIAPLLGNADRFVIAAGASIALVTAYAVTLDLLSKALLLPAAISNAAFPKIAAAHREGRVAGDLIASVTETVAALFVPIAAAMALFTTSFLAVWMDTTIAAAARPVIALLAVGLCANAIAHVPYGAIQACGRPDLTAKAHAVEAPVFLAVLVALVHSHGPAGAAAAWSGRMMLDLALMIHLSRSLKLGIGRRMAVAAGIALLAVAVAAVIGYATEAWLPRILALVVTCTLAALYLRGRRPRKDS